MPDIKTEMGMKDDELQSEGRYASLFMFTFFSIVCFDVGRVLQHIGWQFESLSLSLCALVSSLNQCVQKHIDIRPGNGSYHPFILDSSLELFK